jgi:hypothetical protein
VFEEVRSFAATIVPADLPPGDLPSVVDLFLFGFLRRLAGDAELAARLLRKALTDLERSERADELRVAIPPFVPVIAGAELIDENFTVVAASSYAEFARRTGALTVLPNALIALARVYIREGRFGDAEVTLTEASQLSRATGAPGIPDISAEQRLFLQCWRGDEAEASAQAAALTAARKPPSPGSDLAAAHLALLDLSKGRYRDAFERLAPITREDRPGSRPGRRISRGRRGGPGVERRPATPAPAGALRHRRRHRLLTRPPAIVAGNAATGTVTFSIDGPLGWTGANRGR